MKYWDNEDRALTNLQKFQIENDALLHNGNVREVQNPDGTVSSMPDGIMDRSLSQVSYKDQVEYREKVTALKDKYLEGIDNAMVYNALDRRLNNLMVQTDKGLNKHIADQKKLSYVKAMESDTQNWVSGAGAAMTPEALNLININIAGNVNKVQQRTGTDRGTMQTYFDKYAKEAAYNSGIAVLNATGNEEMAQKQIDSIANTTYKTESGYEYKLSPEALREAKDKVIGYNKGIIAEQREAAKAAKEMQTTKYGEEQDLVYEGKSSIPRINKLEEDYKNGDIENGISPANATKLKGKIISNSEKMIKGKDFKKIKQAIDLVMPDSQIDRSIMYDAALNAWDGDQTADEAKFINKMIKLKKDKKFAVAFNAGHKKLEGFFGAKPVDVEAETKMMLALAEKIVQGQSSDEAFQEVVREQIHEEHPATALHPDTEGAYSLKGGMKTIPKVAKPKSTGQTAEKDK